MGIKIQVMNMIIGKKIRKGKKTTAFVLAAVLSFSAVMPVMADDISDAKQKQEELEEQKKAAEAEKETLAAELNQVIAEMEQAKADLDAKQVEIIQAQDELDIARINENEQYTAMKLRIKYMYENGNAQFIEILFEAKDISDFLNKAEYIQQISDYDRRMLVEFQEIVKQVEEKEAQLKKEEEELTALQNNLINKQGEVETMLAGKNEEISSLESEIGENSSKLKELIAQAEAAKAQQQQNYNSNTGGGGTPGPSQVVGNGQLCWPTTSTRITSYYGMRPVPVAGATSNHDAIDIGAPMGAAVYAADGGTVTTASYGYNGGRGNYIMVNHGNGMVTRYQHLSAIYVSVGQSVGRGENIGAVGSTGASSGPHLDFAVYINGSTVNPLSYL